MILYSSDLKGIPRDINLDKISNMSFYYKKICAVAENNTKNSDSAKIIKKIIEENYIEYLI